MFGFVRGRACATAGSAVAAPIPTIKARRLINPPAPRPSAGCRARPTSGRPARNTIAIGRPASARPYWLTARRRSWRTCAASCLGCSRPRRRRRVFLFEAIAESLPVGVVFAHERSSSSAKHSEAAGYDNDYDGPIADSLAFLPELDNRRRAREKCASIAPLPRFADLFRAAPLYGGFPSLLLAPNAKCRPGPEMYDAGPNAKSRPNPETSDAGGRADIRRTSRNRRVRPKSDIGPDICWLS
jgi:hypothetical protein